MWVCIYCCLPHGFYVYLFWFPMAVCDYLYTDYAVVLVTCVFSSGCRQRPERRERRTCRLRACELLIDFMQLYLSRCIKVARTVTEMESFSWITYSRSSMDLHQQPSSLDLAYIYVCVRAFSLLFPFILFWLYFDFCRECWLKDLQDLKDLLWVNDGHSLVLFPKTILLTSKYYINIPVICLFLIYFW